MESIGLSSMLQRILSQRHSLTLDAVIERLADKAVVDGVLTLGSTGTGAFHPASDYDLLVIESSDLPRYKRASKYRRALVGLGLSKDIVVWTPQEVAEWRNVPNAFITTAVNEGRIVYERPD